MDFLLRSTQELNVEVFKKYCDQLFSPSEVPSAAIKSESKSTLMGPPTSLPRHHNAVPLPNREIKRLKLNEDPPSSSISGASDDKHTDESDKKESDKSAAMPPPTSAAAHSIRGAMPMLPPRAVNISNRPVIPKTAAANSMATQWQGFNAANPPPVTITGVAPWAMNAGASSGGVSPSAEPKTSPGGGRLGVVTKMPMSRGAKDILDHKHQHERDAKVSAAILESDEKEAEVDGFTLMSQYMEVCYPQSEIDKLDTSKAEWNIAQAAASPTLLPSLKFHDLVFGQQLGDGAFSIVKYARHITKVCILPASSCN